MKRILSAILVVLMTVTCLSLAGCGKQQTLKFGLGTTSAFGTVKDADGDVNGSASAVTTAAAVLVDQSGKIVKCVIDEADAKVEFTSKGTPVAATEFKTKNELGANYGMVAYGGAKKEWNEQVAEFCKLIEGKTIDQVKAFVTADGKGNNDVIAAGCTITVNSCVLAVENAVKNATESKATAKDTVKLGFVIKQEKNADATADKDGSTNVVANVAAVVMADTKVACAKTDSVDAKISFTTEGKSTTNVDAGIASKRTLGANYGMAQYGQDLNGDGVVKEWFEQADALDSACAGKTADEISALAVNGYGVDSLQSAGCTIAISDMVAAIVKAAK